MRKALLSMYLSARGRGSHDNHYAAKENDSGEAGCKLEEGLVEDASHALILCEKRF